MLGKSKPGVCIGAETYIKQAPRRLQRVLMSMRKATPTASAYYGAPITYPQHTAVPYPQYTYPQYTAAHYAGQSYSPNAIPQHAQHYNPAHYHVPPPTGAYFGPTHTAASAFKNMQYSVKGIINRLATKKPTWVNGAALVAGHELYNTDNAGSVEKLLGVAVQLNALLSQFSNWLPEAEAVAADIPGMSAVAGVVG